MPAETSYIKGASLPVAGKTAVESLQALDFKKGATLFIAGASGAIGTLVIQLAKNESYMKMLGANMTVDYNDVNWKTKIINQFQDGIDVALAIQPGTAKECLDLVKQNGRIITVSGDQIESTKGVKIDQFVHQFTLAEALETFLVDITEDKVMIEIKKVYSFNEAITALEKTETRHARGKLVVTEK